MDVADCMTRTVIALAPDTSVEAAARLFIENHIGGAPVIDEGGKPVGFLTSKDLLDPDRARGGRRGVPHGFRIRDGERERIEAGPVSAPGVVADVMTQFVVSVPATMPLEEAVRLMLASDLHRVLVCDEGRCIVGILSAMDVIRAQAAPPRP
jgi:CBS domain-containing protein